jgi:peptide/nickel transport system permease protein
VRVSLLTALLGAGVLAALLVRGAAPADTLGTASDVQLRLLARTAGPTLLLIGSAAVLRMVLGAVLGVLRVAAGSAGFLGGLLTLPSVIPEVVVGFVVFWAIFAPQSPWTWLIALTVPGALHVAIEVHARSHALLTQPWIESAVAIGSSRRGLLRRHVFPHLQPALPAVFATQAAASAVLLGELVLVTAYVGDGSSLVGIQISALQATYTATWGMALPPALRAITQGDLLTVFIPVVAFASLLALFNGAAAVARGLDPINLRHGPLPRHR